MTDSTKQPFIPDDLPIDFKWDGLVGLVSQANRAIARYDGTLNGIVNSAVLLSPITANEAVLSSRIEGTHATLGEVLEHEAGQEFEEEKEKDIQEIMNYRRALLVAEKHLQEREISLSLLKELHMILMSSVRGENKNPGEFRRDQNWIGKPGRPIEEARFVPPDPLVMQASLDNLEEFISKSGEDPIVQMAIIHAQFEIIHPFNDGNGRLGRMLIPLYLSQSGVLQRPVFYLSEFLEENDAEYRDRLLAITDEGDWYGWIQFFLKGVVVQAERNTQKAEKIHELYVRMRGEFSDITNSKYASAALDTFFSKPIINASDFHQLSEIPTKVTSNNILNALKKAKLIKIIKEGKGQSPSVYVMPELINISEGKTVF